MKTSLKIGFLTPYSGVYPYYSYHLVTGWLLGMGLDPTRQRTIEFVQEYTHMGSLNACETAARKLLFFQRVDVLSGLVNYKAVPGMVSLIESDKRPAFFFDMGEYVPYFPYLSPNIFYASQQVWQSQYALGHWAQAKWGTAGHIITAVYEAGYHLNSSFQQGVFSAGGTELQLSILPFNPDDPQRMELDGFFAQLAKEKPPYVHAILCGNMGNRFLEAWVKSGFHKKIPLLVFETMAYDDILDDIKSADLEIYSAQLWMREDENKANQAFVKTFENLAKQPANIYSLMGYEAGLIWKELLPYALKNDWSAVKQQLREGVINGPRGEKNFYPSSGFALPSANILKITTSNNKIHKIILDQGKGMRFDAKELEVIHRESASGWQNPLLCI